MKKAIALVLALLLLAGCATVPDPVETLPSTETTVPTSCPTTAITSTTTAPSIAATTETATGTTAVATAATTVTTATTVSVTATTAKKTKPPKPEFVTKQLIPNPDFTNGIDISSNVKGKKGLIPEGTWRFTDSTADPVWNCNQSIWKSYADRSAQRSMLLDNISTTPTTLSDGMRTLSYNPETGSMMLGWDSYAWYNGVGHKNGDKWPVMILGQSILPNLSDFFALGDEQDFYRCDAEKIVYSIDVRMPTFQHKAYSGVNAFQFLTFFYIKTSKAATGFVWFGVPLFDDRWADKARYNKEKPYFTIDAGSGCYIFHKWAKDVYANALPTGRDDFFTDNLSAPEPNDEWLHLEVDLRPWLEEMAEMAIAAGIFPNAKSTHDLYICGMNIGYEVHGSYRCTFEIKNLALTSYLREE